MTGSECGCDDEDEADDCELEMALPTETSGAPLALADAEETDTVGALSAPVHQSKYWTRRWLGKKYILSGSI